MKVRLVGDVHGMTKRYYNLVKDMPSSIQVGDLGFDYRVLYQLSHIKHKVIPGNHDNYDIVDDFPHMLNGFGLHDHLGLKFFYVRGAFSIDWKKRLQLDSLHRTKSWWNEEELPVANLYAALELYETVKPDIVITHDCPRSIVSHITNSSILVHFGYDPKTFTTNTNEALEDMFRVHQPKLWVGGHYHKWLNKDINGTRFIILPELGYVDLETDTNTVFDSKGNIIFTF